MDEATKVSVFLNGLREGPVRTQLFRAYPESMEQAITLALQEEFSLRQSRNDGYTGAVRSKTPHRPSDTPTPMDISAIDARPAGDKKNNSSCHRCGRPGHFARECRAPVPAPNGSQRPGRSSFRRLGGSRQPKNGVNQ